jgi:lysozyme family protein
MPVPLCHAAISLGALSRERQGALTGEGAEVNFAYCSEVLRRLIRSYLMSFILFSVGRGGVNMPADVMAVHAALDRYELWDQSQAQLFAKPQMSLMLESRISAFQRKFAPFQFPDGLLQPNSMVTMMLAAYGAADDGPKVTYADSVEQDERLVSDYAIKVVKKALVAAKMSAGVITSTIRLPQKQAEIMYGYASKNLAQQYKLYANAGDQVLKVFEDNRTKSKAEVIALMTAKVEALYDKGIKVSNHVSTVTGYSAYNVFDIGVNSTKAKAGKTFNLAGLTKAFEALKKEGYLADFINETMKTNNCWHLEIVPGSKAL